MQRCSVGPERGGIKGDVYSAEIIIPSPTVLVPEHQVDIVWHRLYVEIKVKGGIPDGVQRLADHIRRELVPTDRELDIWIRKAILFR